MRVDWVEEFLIERIIQLSFRNVKKNMSIKHMIWMRGNSKVQKLFWAVTETKTSMCYQVLPWGGPSEENKWKQSQHKTSMLMCYPEEVHGATEKPACESQPSTCPESSSCQRCSTAANLGWRPTTHKHFKNCPLSLFIFEGLLWILGLVCSIKRNVSSGVHKCSGIHFHLALPFFQ